MKRAGVTPFSLCTDIGWPVADLWQNVYLKTAGAASYDALAAHDIAWTSPTVTTAFDTLSELIGQPSYLLGGTKGALANDYPACVDKVFPKPGTMPQAAMVIEGDFVVSEIVGNSSGYTAGTTGAGGKKSLPARPVRRATTSSRSLRRLQTRRTPRPFRVRGTWRCCSNRPRAAKALIKYLGSPEAGEIWHTSAASLRRTGWYR